MNRILTILICFSISIAASSQTFTNSGAITINDSSPASPFPSTIVVSGAPAVINTFTVTITGFSHTWPSDVDVVLASPNGEAITLMSDCGSGTDVSGATYVFDDAAPANMTNSVNNSGTFRPSDFFIDTYGSIPGAINYSATAGTATFASVFTGDPANGTWSLYVIDDLGGDSGSISGGWSITFTAPIPGCTDQNACNYNELAQEDDGSCDYSCFGCTYAVASNFSPLATIDDGSCIFNIVADGCTDPTACNYCSLCANDDGSCDYSCLGCTYANASNYSSTATRDDGSCIFEGCTDPTAINYTPMAQVDDGTCYFDFPCQGDINNDGIIGVGDLVVFLAFFGLNCPN
ncbi:MAG: hypothetical protein ACOYLH_11250 [Flavobacteriales bacterium]